MRPHLVSAVLLLLGARALAGSPASAQPARDFSSVRYRPAVGPGNYLGLEGARIDPHGQVSYALAFDYATDTLVAEHPCRELANVDRCAERGLAFIEQSGLAHALLSVSLAGNTQLSFDLPLGGTDAQPLFYTVNNAGTASPFREFRLRDDFVLADLRVASKTRLYANASDTVRLAAVAFSTAPTARLTSGGDCRDPRSCTFLGERTVHAGAFGVLELEPVSALRFAVNVGALYRPSRNLLGSEVGSELSFGVAAAYEVVASLALKAELAAALELAGADDLPLEARGGVSYGRELAITAGGGAGVLGDVGSPRYRVFAGLQWTPVKHAVRDADRDQLDDARDRCPEQSEDRDGFEDDDGCPDADNDGDGVLDERDRCDLQREDKDGFEDEDGCADPDNDRDGVPDGYDTCEGQKEDVDGDRDDDGCPDLDTDRDGVLDANDRCVDQPEDTDGLGDEDGCPDPDYDGDGLNDDVDVCPERAESRNGRRDDDGCPD